MSIHALTRHERDTNTRAVSLTLPVVVLDAIDAVADLEGCNRSFLVAKILEDYLSK